MKRYYLDTSIWLDFFENRNEPGIPKGDWANEVINKIISEDDRIVYSDNVVYELEGLGYAQYQIIEMFSRLKEILIFVEATDKQIGKAKDLAAKRNIPKRDALHALIARDCKSTLITLDRHFREISDITKPVRPQDVIYGI